ncbi:CHAD domain-containing protein [Rhodohalobacter barkolensis]|uniref:CHAD domain-containing protein n=1 Tax=Rhodohalobacter barkolensis TaxID=2053187 RepID=UPI0013FD32CA|nr:CHAD domain-containing protein [Rhodohalobacter barkolensis]
MDTKPFVIPDIPLKKHLKRELLHATELIRAELLCSVRKHRTDIVESTHLTRKRLKLFRAFFKLLKECGDRKELKELNTTFRKWGQSLSELRDVHVHKLFIEEVIANPSEVISTNLLQEIREIARQQVDQMEQRLVAEGDLFKNMERQIDNYSLIHTFIESNQFDAACILKGFKVSFQKSHQAFIEAESSKLSEPFHEWRKRLKDVQYQLDLLRSHQKHINVSVSDVEQICEILGKDQDLNNFIHWMDKLNLNTKSVKDWVLSLRKSQHGLKHQLIAEGNRFYKHSSI